MNVYVHVSYYYDTRESNDVESGLRYCPQDFPVHTVIHSFIQMKSKISRRESWRGICAVTEMLKLAVMTTDTKCGTGTSPARKKHLISLVLLLSQSDLLPASRQLSLSLLTAIFSR